MTDVITETEMIDYLKAWGADNKLYLELEGEVGFGRECVGLVKDSAYPSYGWFFEPGNYMSKYVMTEEARPPEGVTDAYHKHDALCVLGRGEDVLRQLYIWVKNLEANNVVTETVSRHPPNEIDAIMHGLHETHLIVKEQDA